jgi:hypothetical protein
MRNARMHAHTGGDLKSWASATICMHTHAYAHRHAQESRLENNGIQTRCAVIAISIYLIIIILELTPVQARERA